MLGCHDFNGYYEWTFHFLRQTYGEEALNRYWAEAIASDSQQHYVAMGREQGLRGLYQAWAKTGVEEKCDWEVTLDEDKNVLRLDMYNCPSKGFLLNHDLNADEDYCDHCIGWIGPALVQIGAEVATHEHNHCGQCWWEIRLADRPTQSLVVDYDARANPDWQQGYLHRFVAHKRQQPSDGETIDSAAAIIDWFATAQRIVVLVATTGADEVDVAADDGVIMTADRFLASRLPAARCTAVILDHAPERVQLVADKYHSLAADRRPLLLSAFLPNTRQDAVAHGLPRPTPLLPLLIRSGCYFHRPREPSPSPAAFAILLALALKKCMPQRDAIFDPSASAAEAESLARHHILPLS
jgi:hypothetical protein